MTHIPRFIAVIAAGLAVSGCAAAGASLDRFEDRVEARSTCHTSSGDFLPGPGCVISYSATVSSTTTTTTTATTTTTPAAPAADDD